MIVHADLLEHFFIDMLIKSTIIGVGVIVVAIAIVVLWRILGRPRPPQQHHPDDERRTLHAPRHTSSAAPRKTCGGDPNT
ncbi:hypothetical protein [Paramicrobacterium fandaimingii]|uniref:hypothetical protein n=1 Tax=Paramicrobacterium fandaimingii TaxID=2708079 RepID=UPI00141F8E28|nr:hypothetical protein [Microbacterium fandaimingii]